MALAMAAVIISDGLAPVKPPRYWWSIERIQNCNQAQSPRHSEPLRRRYLLQP